MSLAMGIMITYGSYMKKDTDLRGSVRQIELFDTLVAFLAGLMIVPSVFVFSGGSEEALNKGPSLMFVTLPKVFESMKLGGVIGAAFFILVLFAALTSSISLLETNVSMVCDKLHWSRKKATIGYFVKPKAICDEVEINKPFKEKKFYIFMLKYAAPVCLVLILIFAVSEAMGWIKV